MRKVKRITIMQMFVLGWLIRLVLSPFFRHPSDVQYWKLLGVITYDLGVNPLPYTSFYGLGWLCSLLASYPLYLIASLTGPSDLLLNLIVKLPILIGDFFTGVVLFKITKSRLATALWLFNPYVIFISSIHGQFDVIPTLLTLLSVFFLAKKQYVASAISFAVGLSYKTFPIFLLPFLLLFSFRNFGKKIAIKYAFISIFASFILFMPYFLPENFKYFYEGLMLDVPQRELYYVGSSVSYLEFLIFHLRLLSGYNFVYMFVPMYVVLIFFSIKFVRDIDGLNKSIILTLLLLYVTYSTMHPQFLVWVLPFLVIEYVRKKTVPSSLLNLMWIWVLLWIISWDMRSFLARPLQEAFSTYGTATGYTEYSKRLLLIFSMNFSAYAFACLIRVQGSLSEMGVFLPKWLQLITPLTAILAMDIILYTSYGNFGLVIPVVCFIVYYPLIVVSYGWKAS